MAGKLIYACIITFSKKSRERLTMYSDWKYFPAKTTNYFILPISVKMQHWFFPLHGAHLFNISSNSIKTGASFKVLNSIFTMPNYVVSMELQIQSLNRQSQGYRCLKDELLYYQDSSYIDGYGIKWSICCWIF